MATPQTEGTPSTKEEGTILETVTAKATEIAASVGLISNPAESSQPAESKPEVSAEAAKVVDEADDEKIGDFLRDKYATIKIMTPKVVLIRACSQI